MDDSQPKAADNTCKGTNGNTGTDVVDGSGYDSNSHSSAEYADQRFPDSDLEISEDEAADVGADDTGSESEVNVERALASSVDVGGSCGVVKNASEGEASEDEASANQGDECGVTRASWKRLAWSNVEDYGCDKRKEASKDIDVVSSIIIVKQRSVGRMLFLHELRNDVRESPSNVKQQDHNKGFRLAQPAHQTSKRRQQRGAKNHRDPFCREADLYIAAVEAIKHLVPKRQQKGSDLHADSDHDQRGNESRCC